MKAISYKLDIGYSGCDESGTMEVPDDMTNEQIDAMIEEMANEYAQSWEGDNRLGWWEDMTEEEYEQETEIFYENVGGSWDWIDYA